MIKMLSLLLLCGFLATACQRGALSGKTYLFSRAPERERHVVENPERFTDEQQERFLAGESFISATYHEMNLIWGDHHDSLRHHDAQGASETRYWRGYSRSGFFRDGRLVSWTE